MAHLTLGDDLLFNHILREDLRRMTWRTLPASRYEGVEKGIDYTATVRDYRAQPRKGINKKGAQPPEVAAEEPGSAPRQLDESYKMDKVGRGLLRCIWAGGMNSSLLLYRSRLVNTPTCPLCGAEKEDDQHLFWECPLTEAAREPL